MPRDISYHALHQPISWKSGHPKDSEKELGHSSYGGTALAFWNFSGKMDRQHPAVFVNGQGLSRHEFDLYGRQIILPQVGVNDFCACAYTIVFVLAH